TGLYLVSALKGSGLARRPTIEDVAMLLLVALAATSALVNTTEGSPRLAINMLWEWIALGVVYFLVRQLDTSAAETRALAATMLPLAVVMSSYGFYQVFIGMPADRAAYAKNPEHFLRELGQRSEPDSPERMQFENRLNSTEPLATFALTNSLAGFLAAWLI